MTLTLRTRSQMCTWSRAHNWYKCDNHWGHKTSRPCRRFLLRWSLHGPLCHSPLLFCCSPQLRGKKITQQLKVNNPGGLLDNQTWQREWKTVSQSCAAAKSQQSWRTTGQSNLTERMDGRLLHKPVSQSCAVANSEQSWRTTGQSNLTEKMDGRLFHKLVSQSCAVANSEQSWRATGQSNLIYKRLPDTKASTVWFSYSHNYILANGSVFCSDCQVDCPVTRQNSSYYSWACSSAVFARKRGIWVIVLKRKCLCIKYSSVFFCHFVVLVTYFTDCEALHSLWMLQPK